jgi:hypothetical protein
MNRRPRTTQENINRLARHIAAWQREIRQREQNAANGLLQLQDSRPFNRSNITLPVSQMVEHTPRWNARGITINGQLFKPLNRQDKAMFRELKALPPQVRKAVTARYMYDTRHPVPNRRTRYSSINAVLKATTKNGISGRALARDLNITIPPRTGYKPHRHGAGLEKSVREFIRTGSIRHPEHGLRISRQSHTT